MAIRVELSRLLRGYVPDYDPDSGITVEYEEGKTAAHIIAEVGIPSKMVYAVLVNRKPARTNYKLQDGDRVTLMRVIGAG